MAFVGDSYIVKELSRSDHRTLRQVAHSYGRHLMGGPSLMVPVYLHFLDHRTGMCCMVMRNVLGRGRNFVLYDLKGCDDDKTIERNGETLVAVRSRLWYVCKTCLCSKAWSEARRRYLDGKLAARDAEYAVPPAEREWVLACIRRDTDWLLLHSLMDYSLLVAVRRGPALGGSFDAGSSVRDLTRDRGATVHLGIIDFLQRWTLKKRAAQCLKCLQDNRSTVPPAMYAERFYRHFEERFVPRQRGMKVVVCDVEVDVGASSSATLP